MNSPKVVPTYPSSAWVERLCVEIATHAAQLSGTEVVDALWTASMDAWNAGLDHAFDAIRQGAGERFEQDAVAFDTSWMTLFAVELAKRSRTALAMRREDSSNG